MKGIQLLVVDDDPDVLRLAASFFEREGASVVCISGGAEAVQLIRENTFSLVITDLHMPDMKGFELAVRIREFVPEMPILMITADDSRETRDRAREVGILEVFAKPLRLHEIAETVREVLRRVS